MAWRRSACGWVVWRETRTCREDLVFSVPYLGGQSARSRINFSRPAGQVIAQYYNFLRLGRDGYRRIQQACYDTAQWLAKRDRQARAVRVHLRRRPARQAFPRCASGVKAGRQAPLYAVRPVRPAAQRGWQVPAFPLPGEANDIAVMRIMIRHGFSRDMAALLVDDIKRAIDHFDKHPITVPMTQRRRRRVHTHILMRHRSRRARARRQ